MFVAMHIPLPALVDQHRPDLVAAIASMPCSRLFGISVVGLGEGAAVIELSIRADLTFDGRTVQGGIVGTLADYAAVSAATAASPTGWVSSTTAFQVYNLAPARGERLVGIGRLIKGGRSQAVAAADVYAVVGADAELVATALATCKLIAPTA